MSPARRREDVADLAGHLPLPLGVAGRRPWRQWPTWTAGGDHATITARVPADHVRTLAEPAGKITKKAGQAPLTGVLDAVRAPGAARTASARTQRVSELCISAMLAIERRRRRST